MFHGHDYSFHSDEPKSRSGVYFLLAIVAGMLSAVCYTLIRLAATRLGWTFSQSDFFVPLYTGTAPLAIYSLILNRFDQKLWNTPIGDLIYWLATARRPPDIDGFYEGTSTWFDLDDQGRKIEEGKDDVKVRIRQTWERIGVSFEFTDLDRIIRSSSHSDMAFIESSFDGTKIRIQYTYSYERRYEQPGRDFKGIKTIRGACSLDFTKQDGLWRATGHYYADNGTSGEVILRQSSADHFKSDEPKINSEILHIKNRGNDSQTTAESRRPK